MVPNLLGGSTMHKKNAKLLTLFVQDCSEKSFFRIATTGFPTK